MRFYVTQRNRSLHTLDVGYKIICIYFENTDILKLFQVNISFIYIFYANIYIKKFIYKIMPTKSTQNV